MNAQAIEYRLEPVLSFVQARMPGLLRRDHMVGMGWLRRGEMVAAVVFENYNQRNIWVRHVSTPSRSAGWTGSVGRSTHPTSTLAASLSIWDSGWRRLWPVLHRMAAMF